MRTWWPLALSWLLMAAEGPAISAVAARLPNPEINLAAFGGIVYPLALIIEAPIIMLLSASTALCRDWDSYRRLRRFMTRVSIGLTILHGLLAFTPLYDLFVVRLIAPPVEIVEPARVGLMIMLPWTWAIAYRRFQQGVLIRFDHSRSVGFGTLIRLCAAGVVLTVGYLIGTVPGIVVATAALSISVVSEAVYAGLRVRPVLRRQLKPAPPVEEPLTFPAFIEFYIPLAMTSLLRLLAEPLSSAALSRMPDALDSLAVWSIVTGFIFLFRSLGVAYNEVVIALLDRPHAFRNLHRFTLLLAAAVTALLLLIAGTPLASIWFEQVSGLKPHLAILSQRGLWIALLVPGIEALQSWYQGLIVHSRHTRAITEAVAIYLATNGVILVGGVLWGRITGLFVGLAAITAGRLAQTIWLFHRSRPALAALEQSETTDLTFCPADSSAR